MQQQVESVPEQLDILTVLNLAVAREMGLITPEQATEILEELKNKAKGAVH